MSCGDKQLCRGVIRSVARFQYLVGHNIFLGGQDFCFYSMFKTNFLGATKFGVHCPRMLPVATGLGVIPAIFKLLENIDCEVI